MGFSITWCAVRDGNTQKVLDQLGLSPTGETEDVPESLISDCQARHGMANHLVQRVRMFRFSGPRTLVSFRMTRKY